MLMEKLRTALQEELIKRCQKNRSYSLRSFAKQLNVPVSTLSVFLNSKRSISRQNAKKICLGLGWPLEDSMAEAMVAAQSNQKNWVELEYDVLNCISSWYHFAILELIKIHKGKLDAALVAERLSIKKMEATSALERLLRMKLISYDAKKMLYSDLNQGFASYYDGVNTSDAHKALVLSLLDKAKESVQLNDLKYRENASVTISLSLKDIDKAKKRIKDFRRSLCEELESTKNPKHVYELSIALFPLTKIEEES